MGRFYELYPGGWQGAVLERVMLGRWISGDMTAAKGRAWSQVRLGGKVSLQILPIQRETGATVHFMGLKQSRFYNWLKLHGHLPVGRKQEAARPGTAGVGEEEYSWSGRGGKNSGVGSVDA